MILSSGGGDKTRLTFGWDVDSYFLSILRRKISGEQLSFWPVDGIHRHLVRRKQVLQVLGEVKKSFGDTLSG